MALALIAEKSWEAANGFDLTDDMMVAISAQAALLVLDLPDDSSGKSADHRASHTVVLTGEPPRSARFVVDRPVAILGQASFHGPVIIAWDTVRREARHPGAGHNVVFHEFAHKLDMLDGTVDGTPPLAYHAEFERWMRVCTAAYERVAAGQGGRTLRGYAGVNPAEFFAVATEAFFDDQGRCATNTPSSTGCWPRFYRQDPARRVPPAAPAERAGRVRCRAAVDKVSRGSVSGRSSELTRPAGAATTAGTALTTRMVVASMPSSLKVASVPIISSQVELGSPSIVMR